MKIAVLMTGEDQGQDSYGSKACAALTEAGHEVVPILASENMALALAQERPDMCFPAFSRTEEQGLAAQELLSFLDIPAVGSEPEVCRLAIDRRAIPRVLSTYTELTDESLAAACPAGFSFSVECFKAFGVQKVLDLAHKQIPGGFPLCVKPRSAACSVAAVRVSDDAQLKSACMNLVDQGQDVLVQQWVEGVTLYVAVLGEGWDAYALPPAREVDDCVYKAPVEKSILSPSESLAEAIRSEIERAAVEVCRAFNVRDMALVKLIWDGAQARIIEVDPSPCICPGSAFAASYEAAGITFPTLMNALVGGME
ncbi:MAG: ATP-grasp domain-containing protein [Eggerthellales bacterium]|nr:ATP-grasp domain-containing protein [Eggerthellales bacterium]